MTVSSTTTPRVEYAGNGVTTNFSITFPYAAESDVSVLHIAADGTETDGVQDGAATTDYTISASAVVMNSAPASGVSIIVYRSTTKTQAIDLLPNRRFPADTEEGAFDKLTYIVQELQEGLSRTLQNSMSSGAPLYTAEQIVALLNPVSTSALSIVSISTYSYDLPAAVAAIGSAQVTLVIDGPTLVDEGTTTPTTLTLWVLSPGNFYDDINDATLTMASPDNIIAGDRQQVFNWGNGTGDIVWLRGGRMSLGWWGITEGGDISTPISQMSKTTNGVDGFTIIYPPGSYTIASKSQKVSQSDNTVLSGYGCKITATDGDVSILEPMNSTNIVVEGFYLDGGSLQRIGGQLIQFRDTINGVVRDCTLLNSNLDGIATVSVGGVGCTNILIENCYIANACRNGISLTAGDNSTVRNCVFVENGIGAVNNAPFAAIDIEAEEYNVRNVKIEDCTFTDNGFGVRQINNTSATGYITIKNCRIQEKFGGFIASDDSDAEASYAIFTESDADYMSVENCYIDGSVYFAGNNFRMSGGELRGTNANQDGNLMRVLGSAGGNCVIDGVTFSASGLSATRSQKFIQSSARTVADGMFTIKNCTFFLVSNMLAGSLDVFDFAAASGVETWIWRENTFYTDAAVTTNHYVPFKNFHFLDNNFFLDQEFTANTSSQQQTTTASQFVGQGRILGPTSLLSTYRERVTLSGASATLSGALRNNHLLLGISAEVVTEITIGGGGTNWLVGTSGDADAFGTSSTLTVGADLDNSDWTFNTAVTTGGLGNLTTPFFIMSDTDILITPDAGTFSAGEVEIVVYMLNTR